MTSIDVAELSTGQRVRLAVRDGRFNGSTAGVAAGYVQANVTIMPAAYAEDFRAFCVANPKNLAGSWLSASGDRRAYRRLAGTSTCERTSHGIWCSSTESRSRSLEPDVALVRRSRGLRAWLLIFLLRHARRRRRASATRGASLERRDVADNHPTPIGPFHGPLVVSMRPIKQRDLERAVRITESLPTGTWRADTPGKCLPSGDRPISQGRITVTRCRSNMRSSPYSGPAASLRRWLSSTRASRLRLHTHPAACS